MKKILVLFISLLLAPQTIFAYTNCSHCIAIPDSSRTNNQWSQYSPWVMHENGWDRYRMYFGRNEEVSGVSADRIYLSENFGDGISEWTQPTILLSPTDQDAFPGEKGLIHDPTVIISDQSVWNMYYTATDIKTQISGLQWKNKIYHAISSNGVNFHRQGEINIHNLPDQTGTFGIGQPSIFYENSKYYLYFFSDTDADHGTIFLAEGTDGHNFEYYGRVSSLIVVNPQIVKHNQQYLLFADAFNTTKIISSTSRSLYGPWSEFNILFTTGDQPSWDSYHIGTPHILLSEAKIYYSGTDDKDTHSSELDNSQIGVSSPLIPGDMNFDNTIDLFDYNLLVASFGHPYTIFDYNQLVANFGKTN